MSKLTTAIWKGVKHGFVTGGTATLIALKTGSSLQELPAYFAVGFLAGIGVNVHAIKGAK